MKVSQPAAPEYMLSDTGFAVLRTSMLPFDAFASWSERVRETLADNSSPADALATLGNLFVDAAFRDAIWVASPSLSREIDAWTANSRRVDERRLLDSIVRYFSRGTYRCTPFGLFAGCTPVSIGERTNLQLQPASIRTRRTRLDMDYLGSLARVLATDPECRRRVPLHANTSAATLAGRIHYVESRYVDDARLYALTAAEATPEILSVLDLARQGTTFHDLATSLQQQGYELGEIEPFIFELLETQLLYPALDPLMSGGDATLDLAATLEAAGVVPAVSSALRSVTEALARIDAGAAPATASDYARALAPLKALPVPMDESRVIQVDVCRPAPGAMLGGAVVQDALEAVRLLTAISLPHDPLSEFAAKFETRYETREVSLIEALDEEVGIGMPRPVPMSPNAEAVLRREAVLADLRCRAAAGGLLAVELLDEDVVRMQWPDRPRLPDALAVFGSLIGNTAAVASGKYRLVITNTLGPSGARLLGRFAHLDPGLEAGIRTHLDQEAALRPDAVYAEIVHMPQGRSGNVIARPALREHELVYLGRGSAHPAAQLHVSDLWVTVRRGRVMVMSEILKREVIPRLSSAHNFAGQGTLPLYHFLCALQEHQQHGNLAWNWGSQARAAFLPRVTKGRLVLSPAVWNLGNDEIQEMTKVDAQAGHIAVAEWRRRLRVPRLAVITQGDNRLLIDFENPVSLNTFIRLIRSRGRATVLEAIGPTEGLCVHAPEGCYTNELVIPLVRQVTDTVVASDRPARIPGKCRGTIRSYAPGSEWLYAKLYCGRGMADRVLRTIVAPLVIQARTRVPLFHWFFVRYEDPDFHVRLRLHTANGAIPTLFDLVRCAVNPAVEVGLVNRLALDTYLPEVERYGGAIAMSIMERVFTHDSDAALALLTADEESENPLPRELAALTGIDTLYSAAGLSRIERMDVLNQALGQVPSAIRREWSKAFRTQRAQICALLESVGAANAAMLLPRVLATRSNALRPLFAQVRALAEADELEVPYESVVASAVHMWINRTLAHALASEQTLYDHLWRAYWSLEGRSGAGQQNVRTLAVS